MNTILEAQEVITRAGNYFVNLKNDYLIKKRDEINVYQFIEDTKAIEVLDQAIQLFTDFQKELDIRNEPTQYYTDDNTDTPKPILEKPVRSVKESYHETNN